MRRRNTRHWLTAFVCSTSMVSVGVVRAQDVTATAPADATAAAEAPAAQNLFAEPASEELPQGQTVNVGSLGTIDLHVKDLDLTKVLQLLSIQSQRNIIASKNVAGVVSADLYGVDFYQALDAILHSNGFGYMEKGQFIYVYTQDELEKQEAANRKQVSKIVRLNYLSAADASTFLSPLLSEKGSISVSGEAGAGFQPSLSNGGANSYAHADTLVIRDYQENVDEILAVLTDLDLRPKQVLVEATILQAKLSDATAFGVDFALFGDLDIGDFTNPLNAVNDMITGGAGATDGNTGGAVVSNPGNVATGPATIKLGFMGSDAAVFVRALDSVTDTTVLATPKLLVLNRQKADLLVGERLGYLSSTATDTSTTQTVEFLDVGTQLTLRPFVSDDDMVRIELRPSVSDGSTRLEGGFIIPDEQTQELTTNVIVASGQTVVLGGLFKEDTTIGRKQIPGFGEIPLLGNLGKGKDTTVERSEVIFLVKPTVMKDERLYAMGEALNGDAQRTAYGARQGLLPWSRTKLTQAAVRDALTAMEAGDEDKALWKTNVALYLDPTMTEAIRLKEQITGKKIYHHQASMLDAAIDATISNEMKDLGVELDAAVEPAAKTEAPAAEPVEAVAEVETQAAAEPTMPEPAFEATPELEIASEVVEASAAPAEEPVAVESTPVAEPAAQANQPATVDILSAIDSVMPGSETPAETWDEEPVAKDSLGDYVEVETDETK